jgi:hypothetical protein
LELFPSHHNRLSGKCYQTPSADGIPWLYKGYAREVRSSPAEPVRTSPRQSPRDERTMPTKLYGLLITRDDHDILTDWCRDQLALYDAVVCLDGSDTDSTRRIVADHPGRMVHLHERDYTIPRKTDHGLRRVVHREIVRRFGVDHWIMCCHADEFCYHDPRKIAEKMEAEGYDVVAWYNLHFLPHPDDLPDWPRLHSLPVPERIRHYHWGHRDSGLPWLETRLFRNSPRITWDRSTHGSTTPHGLERPASCHPILRHYKVFSNDPAWYELSGSTTLFRTHWQGLEHRTGLPFPVHRFEDLFVRSYAPYEHCDRFEGSFDHPWNIGEQYRPGK